VLGLALAVALAWLVERTDMPCRGLVYAAVPMTVAMPGLLQAMAWVFLLSPRSGFINRALFDLFGVPRGTLNIYSLGGMIFIEGLRLVPIAFLMLVPLMRGMDPALEEAAAVCGAPQHSTLRKVTLRLLAPGLFAVAAYQAITALEVFEVPGIIGLPFNFYVFSTKIFALFQAMDMLPTYGQANALAMFYVLVGIAATFLYWRVIRRTERYAVVTGKGYRPRVAALGRWRVPAVTLAMTFIFLSVALPFLVFLYLSFLPYMQPPSAQAFASMSLANYGVIFTLPRMILMLWNTLQMVVVTACVTVAVSFLISWVVVRQRFWGSQALDQLSFIPVAIPGIVAGLAFFVLFLELDRFAGTRLFGTVWPICIGFAAIFISYGTRVMNSAILQIHRDLGEAAAVSGAPPWRMVMRIFLPLILPSVAGLWIWIVLVSVRVAGLPLILFDGSNNAVLAVLMWKLWDSGDYPTVSAMAVLLLMGLFVLVLALRRIGFSAFAGDGRTS
jgi:iron(III) transport system permease protein